MNRVVAASLLAMICTACANQRLDSLADLRIRARQEDTSGFSSATPPQALGTDGLSSCVSLSWIDASSQLHPVGDARTVLQAPAALDVQVGGPMLNSEPCKTWLASSFGVTLEPSAQGGFSATAGAGTKVLWFGVWVWDQFETASVVTHSKADHRWASYALAELVKKTGVHFQLSSEHLKREGLAWVYVRGDVGDASESAGVNILNTSGNTLRTLRVLDTDLPNLFGYRASVPFLVRTTHKGDTKERFSLGVTTAGLFYPMRLSESVSSPFLRNLSLELNFGGVSSVNSGSVSRNFYFLGVGASYAGIVGAGWAYDITHPEPFGFYINLSLFSERGLLGTFPVGQ